MKLNIENIAKIENADIEINGITVIAGENSTGKSTVGKILYCLYTTFCNLEQKIYDQRFYSIAKVLVQYTHYGKMLYYAIDEEPTREVSNVIRKLIVSGPEKVEENLPEDLHFLADQDDYEEIIQPIRNAVSISDEKVKEMIVREAFSQEFKNQIKPLYDTEEKSIIQLTIRGKTTTIDVTDGYKIDNEFKAKRECIIIDDPFELDQISVVKKLNKVGFLFSEEKIVDFSHQTLLNDKLSKSLNKDVSGDLIGNYYAEERLNEFKESIIKILGGDIVEKENRFVFHDNKLNKDIELMNLSAGMKTFTILLKLLENGDIKEQSVIVLDEPEIHLHPSWQLKFAEILVLLQKEFNLNILLATHSPYFINALQVYSAKYEIADKTKYYLAELNEKERVTFEDVTLNPERIYKLLVKPFQTLASEEGL